MYTGIVQAVAPIGKTVRHIGHTQFFVDFPDELTDDLKIGGSINIEGVCMTATSITGKTVTFDAMDATLQRTNLSDLSAGDPVNIERSAKPNEENGGHNIAGHVATTATLVEISTDPENSFIRFRVPSEWAKYIFPRGFLAVNGASLTVAEAEDDVFTIYLIPETIRQTTFARYRPGDRINIEVDHQTMVMVDVMERTLARLLPQAAAAETLRKLG